MNNSELLKTVAEAFKTFLVTGSRSNQKLKILHGKIAEDLSSKLGTEYCIKSLDLKGGKETKIQGRYLNKAVDITIVKDEEPIAGVGVKFVMQNYAQNSVNYFENMLGETANIRSNNIPYFQILIIPDKIPYYEKGGVFKHWEELTQHNVDKYKVLAQDRIESLLHTPTKTLLFVVELPDIGKDIQDKEEYINHYLGLKNLSINLSRKNYGLFDKSLVYNDYTVFLDKVSHYIQSI